MNNKVILFLFASTIVAILLFCNIEEIENIYHSNPTPTEFIIKKNNRKDFKKNRQDWIDNMHRSHPDDNWREIDSQNREINTKRILEIRKKLFNASNS